MWVEKFEWRVERPEGIRSRVTFRMGGPIGPVTKKIAGDFRGWRRHQAISVTVKAAADYALVELYDVDFKGQRFTLAVKINAYSFEAMAARGEWRKYHAPLIHVF